MKIKYSLLVVLMSASLLACEEADVLQNEQNDGAPAGADDIVGTWTVFRYTDDGDNETSYFSNIAFKFDPDGAFQLLRGSQTIASGNWELRDNNTEIDINVPALAGENESLGEELYEIHDDWRQRLDEQGRLILTDDDEQFILLPQNS